MKYTLATESLDGVASSWHELRNCLKWGFPFVLPAWLKVWWEVFGGNAQLYLRTVRQDEAAIGLAPLMVNRETACFIGSADVCDYLDFVAAPGREKDFFPVLLDELKDNGIRRLDLGPLRPESTVLAHLADIARGRGYDILCRPEEVSLELDLPATWDEYLSMLQGKQRHEVRRKLRRLWEAGEVEHRCVEAGNDVDDYMDVFLRLFSLSRDEKADFMTGRMERFFRSLARSMAEIGLLRFSILELDRAQVAMTIGFDYDGSHYLYNSAYDPRFNGLSVGLLSKVLCLKHSIERGVRKWSFLKGGEPYKYQLGGQEVPLYGCQITIA